MLYFPNFLTKICPILNHIFFYLSIVNFLDFNCKILDIWVTMIYLLQVFMFCKSRNHTMLKLASCSAKEYFTVFLDLIKYKSCLIYTLNKSVLFCIKKHKLPFIPKFFHSAYLKYSKENAVWDAYIPGKNATCFFKAVNPGPPFILLELIGCISKK